MPFIQEKKQPGPLLYLAVQFLNKKKKRKTKQSHLYRARSLKARSLRQFCLFFPPQGGQDAAGKNYRAFAFTLLAGTRKACRGQQVRNREKTLTYQKWKRKKSKVFICERNVS